MKKEVVAKLIYVYSDKDLWMELREGREFPESKYWRFCTVLEDFNQEWARLSEIPKVVADMIYDLYPRILPMVSDELAENIRQLTRECVKLEGHSSNFPNPNALKQLIQLLSQPNNLFNQLQEGKGIDEKEVGGYLYVARETGI